MGELGLKINRKKTEYLRCNEHNDIEERYGQIIKVALQIICTAVIVKCRPVYYIFNSTLCCKHCFQCDVLLLLFQTFNVILALVWCTQVYRCNVVDGYTCIKDNQKNNGTVIKGNNGHGPPGRPATAIGHQQL